MAETPRRAGAGARLSGVLERATSPEVGADADQMDGELLPAEPVETSAKGRVAKARQTAKPAKKAKARTLYLDDDLWERILVQAHRRDLTLSDYVASILRRQIPDHRTVRTDQEPEQ